VTAAVNKVAALTTWEVMQGCRSLGDVEGHIPTTAAALSKHLTYW
jgi:hypothetical protein